MHFINKVTGLYHLSSKDIGRMLLYLVAFVPMIYKLISPFFILAGLSQYTIIIIPTMVIIGVILSFREIQSKITIPIILTYIFIAFLLFLSPIIHPDTQEFFNENYISFIFTVSPYVFVGILIDYVRDWRLLRFVARMGVLVQLFWQICLLVGLVQTDLASDESLGEQMQTAYQLLFPIFILIISISIESTKIDVMLLIIGILMLTFMGTRGPIVVFMFFVVGYLLFFKQYKSYAILKKILIIMLFALVYYYLKYILLFLLGLAVYLGFSTRVFDSIINEEIANINSSSGRDTFYGNILSAIKEDSVGFGYGWGGDRLFTPDGKYAHNFELEVLCQFGIIGGGLLLLIIALYIFKSYKVSKSNSTVNFWYVMFSLGIIALQFSNTYIQYPIFFVYIGYLISCRNTPIKLKYRSSV